MAKLDQFHQEIYRWILAELRWCATSSEIFTPAYETDLIFKLEKLSQDYHLCDDCKGAICGHCKHDYDITQTHEGIMLGRYKNGNKLIWENGRFDLSKIQNGCDY